MSSLQTFLIEHADSADDALLNLDDWLARELALLWRAGPEPSGAAGMIASPVPAGNQPSGEDAENDAYRYCVGL